VLLIAAGGGGDALASGMVAQAVGFQPAGIATFAWERKMFDPLPGPRSPSDFEGLSHHRPELWQVGSRSRLRVGKSFLPEVAGAVGCPLYLLDPANGAVGLVDQLHSLAQHLRVDTSVVVDVGGDILAEGDEPGLRSPLADSMILASARSLDNVHLVALGLGLDGELREREWHRAWREGRRGGWWTSAPLTAKVANASRPHFWWHPSEVTGLACLAALGYRGHVELRGEGLVTHLTPDSALVHSLNLQRVYDRNRVARALRLTQSLEEADSVVRRICGRTEMDVERAVAHRLTRRPETDPMTFRDLERLESTLAAYCEEAHGRGVQYLTMRRVAEVLDIRGRTFEWFRRYLRRKRPRQVQPPVFDCLPQGVRGRTTAQHVRHQVIRASADESPLPFLRFTEHH